MYKVIIVPPGGSKPAESILPDVKSMAGLMPTLMREFYRKGIHPDQLQGLLKDIEIYFQNNSYRSRQRLNLELEGLGWGINIIDGKTYERILQLLNTFTLKGLSFDEVKCRSKMETAPGDRW